MDHSFTHRAPREPARGLQGRYQRIRTSLVYLVRRHWWLVAAISDVSGIVAVVMHIASRIR